MLNIKILFVISIIVISQLGFLNAQSPPGSRETNNWLMRQSDLSFQNRMLRDAHSNNIDQIPYTNFIFRVTMKDSSEKEVWSRVFHDNIRKQTYIEWVNKKLTKKDSNRVVRIYGTDVISVQGYQSPPPSRYIDGVITDSSWLFKILDGKIEVYSIYPETIDNITVSAIKETGGELELFDPEKLKLILAGNEKAMRRFEKKDYIGAIRKFNNAD